MYLIYCIIFINIKFVGVAAEPKTLEDINATFLSEIKTFYYHIIIFKIDNFVSFPLFLFVE